MRLVILDRSFPCGSVCSGVSTSTPTSWLPLQPWHLLEDPGWRAVTRMGRDHDVTAGVSVALCVPCPSSAYLNTLPVPCSLRPPTFHAMPDAHCVPPRSSRQRRRHRDHGNISCAGMAAARLAASGPVPPLPHVTEAACRAPRLLRSCRPCRALQRPSCGCENTGGLAQPRQRCDALCS